MFFRLDGFEAVFVGYTDIDSFFMSKTLVNSGRKTMIGERKGQWKNDYGDDGIFSAVFIAPKLKYCLIIIEYGVIDEKQHSKVLETLIEILNRSKVLNYEENKKVVISFSKFAKQLLIMVLYFLQKSEFVKIIVTKYYVKLVKTDLFNVKSLLIGWLN